MSYLEFLRIEFGALNTVAEEETEWQEQCVSDEHVHEVSIRDPSINTNFSFSYPRVLCSSISS